MYVGKFHHFANLNEKRFKTLEFFHTSHDKKVKYTNEKHTFLINIEALPFFSPGRIFFF